LIQGRSLQINKGEQYLIFLQLYKGSLMPVDGSPTAVYGIDYDQILIPQGHADRITEIRIAEADRIPLGTAKSNLLKQK
jgi:hypothetical protein